MKKNLFTLSALCLATLSLIFSGCKKENNDPQEPAQVQTYQMSIQASKGTDSQANGPRRVLSLDGNTLNATWAAGEQVTVYKGETSLGTLTTTEEGASVQFSGEVSGEVEKGDKLTLKYLSANYTGQNGTLAYISANCDYAIATDVEVTGIVDETIYTDGETTFENQQAVVEFNLKDNSNNAAISASELVVTVGTSTSYTVALTPAASKLYVAIPGFAGETVTLTATVGSDTYTYEKTGATFANGKFYQITAKLKKQGPAEYGPFSVSPTQKVNFSQGNLQYTRESTSADWNTGKFSFMDHQYDYIETSDVSGDYANETAIGLFGWATSNLNTPVDNTNYLPTNTNTTNESYGSGITTEGVNWATAYANYDWGANTGDLGTGWRTLTKDEWVYLFNTRTVNGGTGNGKSYTLGQSVNGTPGAVLYPDNYTGATYTTGSDWSTFEDKGCVFLPAAGYRGGTSVYYVGSDGYYWSSTSGNGPDACRMLFAGSFANPASSNYRYSGCSVRLVKNAN